MKVGDVICVADFHDLYPRQSLWNLGLTGHIVTLCADVLMSV